VRLEWFATLSRERTEGEEVNQQLITKDDPDNGVMVVRPQQSLTTTESSRVLAEIQAALTVAQARPRDEIRAIDRIKTACQRPRLAEDSQYEYSKGGSKISGASIRLLECIAGYWGNISFGFRELSNAGGESTVEAFAWVKTFTVPHRIKSGGGYKPVVDPREVYELVANYAQRRVRACLENVIPRDVIEDAVDQCNRTLATKVDLSPDSIKAMVSKFKLDYGVTKDQIEIRLGRSIDSIAPAQFIAMRRIYTSLKDGMSEVKDWFKPIEVAAETKAIEKPSTKDKLKKSAKEGAAVVTSSETPKADQGKLIAAYRGVISKTTATESLQKLAADIDADTLLTDESRESLIAEVNEFVELSKNQ
jgi:hypothetical protein